VIIDSGKFDWAKHADRFPQFSQPEPSYHGVIYTEAMGEAAYIARARTVALRNTGSCLSALAAFQILQGLETLPLRMERHCDNALAVAEFLENNENVEWVQYGGLSSSKHHDLAKKYCGGKPSSLLTFGIKGGFDNAVKFYDALQLFKRLVNIGDAKSLACHPIIELRHFFLNDRSGIASIITINIILRYIELSGEMLSITLFVCRILLIQTFP